MIGVVEHNRTYDIHDLNTGESRRKYRPLTCRPHCSHLASIRGHSTKHAGRSRRTKRTCSL